MESLTKQSIFEEYSLLQKRHLSFSGAHLQVNTTLYQTRPGETKNSANLHLEPHHYRIYDVNIDLRHQYGISVSESQTFLVVNHPSAAMSEEKRLPFAGYFMIIYLPTLTPWAWVSRLQVENLDLTRAHACRPISHAWLKNVSCCHLAWHNFQKYVNSDPCKEQKPCVKWINDNTFLAISDFWSEQHWERARFYTHPKTGTGKCDGFFRFRQTSDVFERLRTSSGIFGKIPALPG